MILMFYEHLRFFLKESPSLARILHEISDQKVISSRISGSSDSSNRFVKNGQRMKVMIEMQWVDDQVKNQMVNKFVP